MTSASESCESKTAYQRGNDRHLRSDDFFAVGTHPTLTPWNAALETGGLRGDEVRIKRINLSIQAIPQ